MKHQLHIFTLLTAFFLMRFAADGFAVAGYGFIAYNENRQELIQGNPLFLTCKTADNAIAFNGSVTHLPAKAGRIATSDTLRPVVRPMTCTSYSEISETMSLNLFYDYFAEGSRRSHEELAWSRPFVVKHIRFAKSSGRMFASSYSFLDRLAYRMYQDPGIIVKVTGHTGATGSEQYNKKLSKSRARAVKSYLVREKNIDEMRIRIEGKGEKQPFSSGLTERGRLKKRRIEIRFKIK